MAQQFEVQALGLNGIPYRIEIYNDNYGGTTVTQLDGDQQFIRFEGGQRERVGIEPIWGREVRINLRTNEDLSPLFGLEDRDAEVRVFRTDTSSLVWKGFILTDLFQDEPLTDLPGVELRAVDGLTTLEGDSFDALSGVSDSDIGDDGSFIRYTDIFTGILSTLYDSPLDIEFAVEWYPDAGGQLTSSDNPLRYSGARPDVYYDSEDGEWFNQQSTLEDALKSQALEIRQAVIGGELTWLVAQPTALSASSVKTWRYDSSGTEDASSPFTRDLSLDLSGADTSRPTREFERRSESAAVTHDHAELENVVSNGGFEDPITTWSLSSSSNFSTSRVEHETSSFSPRENVQNNTFVAEIQQTNFPTSGKTVTGFEQFLGEFSGLPPKTNARLSLKSNSNELQAERIALEIGGLYLGQFEADVASSSQVENGTGTIPVNNIDRRIPEGARLPIYVPSNGSLSETVSSITLTKEAAPGSSELEGDITEEVPSNAAVVYYGLKSTQSEVSPFRFKPGKDLFYGSSEFVFSVTDGSGNVVTGDTYVRLKSRLLTASFKIISIFDDVSLEFTVDGQPVTATTEEASVPQNGQERGVSVRLSSGPSTKNPRRVKGLAPGGFSYQATDWGIGQGGGSLSLAGLQARERLRYLREHLERQQLTVYARNKSPVVTGEEVVQFDGKTWRIAEFSSDPASGEIGLTLIQHADAGTTDLTIETVRDTEDGGATGGGGTVPAVGGGGGVSPRFDPFLWSNRGGVSSKTKDQTSHFKNFISDAASAGSPIYLGQGTDIVVSPSSTIDLSGIPAIVGDDVRIDLSGAHDHTSGPIFKADYKPAPADSIADDIVANEGDDVIEVGSGLNLEAADTILIASLEKLPTARNFYYKGGRTYVEDYPVDQYGDQDPNGSYAAIHEPLRFGYDGNSKSNKVYKITPGVLSISEGITFVGNRDKQQHGFTLDTIAADIDGKYVNFNERAIQVVRATGRFTGEIRNPGFPNEPGERTTKYGIGIGSHSEFHIIGANIHAGRHAVTGVDGSFSDTAFAGGASGGAAFPTDLVISGGTYACLPGQSSDEQGAVDTHAHVSQATITGSKIIGGVQGGADQLLLEGNQIHYHQYRGYYVVNDINDSNREWGTHIIKDNYFYGRGKNTIDGEELPAGQYYEIQSVDASALSVTISGSAEDEINPKSVPSFFEDGTNEKIGPANIDESRADDGLVYDSNNDKVTLYFETPGPGEFAVDDYLAGNLADHPSPVGDLVAPVNPRGPFIESSTGDGMRKLVIENNVFDGEWHGGSRQIFRLLKPTGEPLVIKNNNFLLSGPEKAAFVECYDDVVATGNDMGEAELMLESQVSDLTADISGTSGKESFRRTVRVDTKDDSNTQDEWDKVIASSLNVEDAEERGVSIRNVDTVIISGGAITGCGRDPDNQYISKHNLNIADVDTAIISDIDLTSDVSATEHAIKFVLDNKSQVNIRLSNVDVQIPSSPEIAEAGGGTFNYESRFNVKTNSPETWTDLLNRPDVVDTSTDPNQNGEIRRNGADVKIYSGGQVRNLSGLQTISTIEDDGVSKVSPVSIIDFGGSQFDVTDLGNQEAQVTISDDAVGAAQIDDSAEITVEELAVSDPSEAVLDLTADTDGNAGGTQRWTLRVIDNDGDFVIREETGGGGAYVAIDTNGNVGLGGYTTPSYTIEMNGSLRIRGSSSPPSVSGEFRKDGNDVKVYSGGSVRNLSDIGGSGPAGSANELQYNDGTGFASDSTMTYNETTDALEVEQLGVGLGTFSFDSVFGSISLVTFNVGAEEMRLAQDQNAKNPDDDFGIVYVDGTGDLIYEDPAGNTNTIQSGST